MVLWDFNNSAKHTWAFNSIESEMLTLSFQTSGRVRRAVTALPERLWPNATVPYVMGPNVTGTYFKGLFTPCESGSKSEHRAKAGANKTNTFVVHSLNWCVAIRLYSFDTSSRLLKSSAPLLHTYSMPHSPMTPFNFLPAPNAIDCWTTPFNFCCADLNGVIHIRCIFTAHVNLFACFFTFFRFCSRFHLVWIGVHLHWEKANAKVIFFSALRWRDSNNRKTIVSS